MKIATVLSVHDDPKTVDDTIDSIKTYVGDDILVLVDGASWSKFENYDLGVPKLEGFVHGVAKSPYRNVALSLKKIYEMYPDSDWYCYTEYDTLFTSERFKENLRMAEEKKVWMLGNDGHVDDKILILIQSMLSEAIVGSYYLLGCCLFFHRDFILKLNEVNFFEKFLHLTNGFQDGFFPFYQGYDLSENLYPTLCRHYGGNIGVFAHYDSDGTWHGAYKYFPIRWKPEIDPNMENYPEASIIHPLKTFDHPIRNLHRENRKLWKSLKSKEKLLDVS